jgi:hypothetical protein
MNRSTSRRYRPADTATASARSPALATAEPRLMADTVESPLHGNRPGGFGERPGETDREQSRQRAPGRLTTRRVTTRTSQGPGAA